MNLQTLNYKVDLALRRAAYAVQLAGTGGSGGSVAFADITGDPIDNSLLTDYISTELASLVDSAPSTLDTLNELAAALGDDANFSTSVTNALAAKMPITGGTKLTIADGTTNANGIQFGTTSPINVFADTNNRLQVSGTLQFANPVYGSTYNNAATGNNAQVLLGNTGAFITRNIADSNAVLTVNQIHASSTGKILDLQFNGSSKANFDKDGNLTLNQGSGTNSITIRDASISKAAGSGFQFSSSVNAAVAFLLNSQSVFTESSGQLNLGTGTWTSIRIDKPTYFGVGSVAPTHTITLPSTATGIAYYNTTDQTTNYERVRQYWSGNNYIIATEIGGTGTERPIKLQTASNRSFTLGTGSSNAGILSADFASIGAAGSGFGVTGTLTNSLSGIQNLMAVVGTVSQSSTSGYRALWISPFENTVGSGSKYLIDAGTNSAASGGGTHTSKFSVDNAGNVLSSSGVYSSSTTLSLTAVNSSSIRFFQNGSENGRIQSGGNFILQTGGTYTDAGVKLQVKSTTEQLRLQYDDSNYFSATVASNGAVTFNSIGIGSSFTIPTTIVASGSFRTNATVDNSNFVIPSSTSAGNTSTASWLFSGASNIHYRIGMRGSSTPVLTANYAYASTIIAEQTLTEGSSGTHPMLSQFVVKPLVVTDGTATTTDAATVYITGAMTGVTVTGRNDALRVDGTSYQNGDLTVNGKYRLSALNTAPSSATDTGTTGEIRVTSTFIYICTATNTWVRAALSTW
jgi:hypothetical protein